MNLKQYLESIIKKSDGWYVISKKGKNLGGPYSKEKAKKRLKQVEYFKHIKEG